MAVPGPITPAIVFLEEAHTSPAAWDQWPRKGLNGRGRGGLEGCGWQWSQRKGRRKAGRGGKGNGMTRRDLKRREGRKGGKSPVHRFNFPTKPFMPLHQAGI